ncbi:MAG: MarR family winged helix-turn-helix transcriptional regulator, partial [Acidimicrobiia bacterium]
IIARISRAAHLLEKAQDEVFASFGLHRGGFDVLAALRRAGAPFCLSPTALYNSLLISSGAMTHRLDGLAKAGLIERVPAPHDGRSLLVKLTDSGLVTIDAAIAAHLDNEVGLVAALTNHDLEFLQQALRNLLLAHGDRPHAIDSVEHAAAKDLTR